MKPANAAATERADARAENRRTRFAIAFAMLAGGVLLAAAAAHPLLRNLDNLRTLHSLPQPLQRPAIDHFGMAIPAIPNESNDPVTQALSGDARWCRHDVRGAREAWAAAGDYYRLTSAGAYLEHSGDARGAEAMYASALALRPATPQAALALAGLQWNSGRRDAAAKTYEWILEQHGREMGEVPYASLATIYGERGEFGRAGPVLARGLAMWPRSILLRTTTGITAARAGQTARAIDTLRRVVAEAPAANDACFWLGWTYERAGRDSEAARQFSSCLERNPNDIRTLYELGITMMRLHDSRAARASFQRILALTPGDRAASDRLRETEGALR